MLRKILAVNHWTQKVRETTVSRDEQGVLNLQVQGGAEYGQLIHLGKAQDGKSHYPGGKVQAGDLLLQVNEAPVPGLTLRDTLAMLRNTSQPIRIKTVPQGSQLNCDVRHYLKQSFSKGSADFELQQRIRQNLYIRATPCTMRAPRHDEIPGVDYHFVNLSEFQALERAGGLLESGGFEGNYYGTPVPPIIPVDSGRSPPLTPTPDPLTLRSPQRSKSLHNLEKGSGEAEDRSIGGGRLEGTSLPTGSTANVSPGQPAPIGTNRSPALETGTEGHGTEARTQPENRELTPNTTGQSHQSKQTLGRPDVSALIGKDVPLTLAHSVVTTITKTNNTFGFTIAGGNKPHELLQIISLASGGPAERSGEMEIHDVVVAVDKISVLGSTHSEVVRLFQAVAEGDRAELQLHRGYPALYKMEPRQLSETNACAPLPSPAPLALIPVALMQSSNGPGFAVEARGSGGGGYARVQRIWDGHRCPCLAVGDLIVKVNGQRVRVLSDEQLDEVLRTHTRAGDVVLLVQRAVKGPAIGTQVSPDSIRCSADGSARPQAGYTERGDGDGAGQPPRKACQRPHGPEAPWSDGPEQKDSGKPPEAITHQRGDEGSELVALSMDKASPATSIIPWRFSQMTRTSPVDRCETARAGDHTETLNGRQHWVEDADPSLKPRLAPWERNGASCKADAREPVRRSWSRPAELDDPRVSSRAKMRGVHPDQDSELYSVELERSPTGFGFSVRGGREYNMGLYVLGLIVGGPAMRSGKIKIGDQLLEINSELTLGITHSRAVDLIKEGRDKIRLLMRRGDGQVPKYTPDTPGETDRGAAAEHPVRQQQPDPLITPGRTKLQSHSRGTQTRPEPEPEAQARPEPEAQALPHPEPEAQSRVASSPDPALAWKRGQLDVESEGRARGSRPQEATLEGGDTDSRPTTDGSRGCGLSGCRGRDYDWPQALLDPPRPQALPHPRPRPAESSETESDGSWSGASDRGPSSEESSPLGSFDKQRLLNSMVGRLLDGPLAKEAEAGGYCVHCWRRSRRALTPGPWIVPKREKLLEIMDGSWLS